MTPLAIDLFANGAAEGDFFHWGIRAIADNDLSIDTEIPATETLFLVHSRVNLIETPIEGTRRW